MPRTFPQIQRAEDQVLQNRGAEELIVRILEQQPHPPPNRPEIGLGTPRGTEGTHLSS